MPVEFEGGNSTYTLGVEEELCIVDAETGELVPKIEEVMARLPEDLCEYVSYELFQSVLEIKTPPCETVSEAASVLRGIRSRVGSWTAACDASLASAGTHPFSRYRDQLITEQERYKKVIDTLRWVAEREVIFGQHVHVAVPGPAECIQAHNRLAEQAPLLLALSANSPFWQGMDTGFESSRVKVFETFPRAGMPPAFPDYEAFENYVDMMVHSGAMDDYTYCWWDVRPHSKFGTIELRVFDSQTALKDTVGLTALTQCIVRRSIEDPSAPKGPYNRELGLENKWRASRHGMNADFYSVVEQANTPARDLARSLVENLREHAQDLDCEDELLSVFDIIEGGTGSQRQREVYAESGDLLDVVAYLIENTRPAMAGEPS
ncbi:carboxylate-amine ligase, YbdK family [Rubrobacter radiotolerans]|uniref:Putative glutamate--cysteine ligase 2 n=1 Tax=Rubrobacter radiotolerans TaxID=42256 RepID=A0A023WZX0_RUBRA|nr:glutamate--cysteine ligase [Rubrobacter radiotolerans]AHY45315.1 carboxylate-amine ligase, YbdK family [Rubrobacter radiotolerans]MDX5892727.1 glutamate--cysteine ligase [Rubrobacter radiotolerans]SMC02364.1 carboxylate-amine ligase [Rubrobacter radiotolerans DSM 5868]